MLYSFDVTCSTHDDLKCGVIALPRALGSQVSEHTVTVEAQNHTEAFEIAFSMLYCRGWYVTGIYDRI